MFNIGPLELMIILIIALLVVGPKRLPEVGRSIGRGLREFRKAQDEVRQTLQFDLEDEPEKPASRPAATAPPVPEPEPQGWQESQEPPGATTPQASEPVGDTTEEAPEPAPQAPPSEAE